MSIPDKYNHALTVSYSGTHFSGFQLQGDLRTVQGELEKALAVILRESVRIHCCGRTDAGVHATGQVASFQTVNIITKEHTFLYALNSVLPKDISVISYSAVPVDFHPRFSCLAREYEYLIWNAETKPVHLNGRVLWYKRPIPIEELNLELLEILGERDFAALTRVEYKDKTTHRYLDKIQMERIFDPCTNSNNLISIRIRGNSFLHNMIRILVGTILYRASGKLTSTIPEIIQSKDRIQSGYTAPPDGLFFRDAYYSPMEGVTGLKYLNDYPRFRK